MIQDVIFATAWMCANIYLIMTLKAEKKEREEENETNSTLVNIVKRKLVKIKL